VEQFRRDSDVSLAPRGGWRRVERLAWTVGLACLVSWAVLYAGGRLGARHEILRFASLQAEAAQQVDAPPLAATQFATLRLATPDLSLWDPERIVAWRASLQQTAPPPLAVLRIPRLALEVPVLPGTDDFVLDRAVGHIPGTALPGADGNSAIAGHRDGFFRGLKDIALGDGIDVETLEGTQSYRVERTWIVDDEEVWVLDDTPMRSITLVTCYPFYFVGSAPKRFIVRAVLDDTAGGLDAASR
jgi:sortase A